MSEFKFDLSKLEEMTAASEDAYLKLQEAIADLDRVNPPDTPVDNSAPSQDLINRVANYMRSVEGRMGYLQDTITNHMSDGHLPPIKSRAQMSKAVKNLGMDDEYEIPKKVVYASSKHGPIAIIGKDVEIPE